MTETMMVVSGILIAVVIIAILVVSCIGDSIMEFAKIKYGGAKKIDALSEQLEEINKRLKKLDDEKIIEKVRSLDNRFGRL
jgi:uncharacterized protein YoxC